MPLAKDDDVIKAFPPDRANQPFRMAILPWRLGRDWPVTNAHGAKPPGENLAIEPVAIADDVLRQRQRVCDQERVATDLNNLVVRQVRRLPIVDHAGYEARVNLFVKEDGILDHEL